MKTLSNSSDRQEVVTRIGRLSPADAAKWGKMSVHQMICHLNDSYLYALGEKAASAQTGLFQRTVMKWVALQVPLPWPKGIGTRPEMEQGNGGSPPIEFNQDRAALVAVVGRFCGQLPQPVLEHPIFGPMTPADWLRWGYLHADHHLRQFGR
ncbi:MAG: DUF1569 domain-containing protein [Bryobacteraceae bacterium]